MEHPNELDQQLENLRTLQQSYDQIAGAAEAYNVGKTELAAAITAKGVATDPTETYPEMAEKVNAISQETYEINGGEMYAKQLFGSLTTPNYWNLYEIMAQLLSDGRLVNYGGILLAEYYKGYNSLALSGAGSGGAYVVSDKDSDGNFIMYTEDTTHTWATEDDGKGNRWVAYCFADAAHGFSITDTNTCPRSIHIGRHVGVIDSLVTGRVANLVVTDGNTLDGFCGNVQQNFGGKIVIRNTNFSASKYMLYQPVSESIYISGDSISTADSSLINLIAPVNNLYSLVIKANSITGSNPLLYTVDGSAKYNVLSCIYISAETISASLTNAYYPVFYKLTQLSIMDTEACNISFKSFGNPENFKTINLGYKNNDKTKSVVLSIGSGNIYVNVEDVVLMQGWCKPLNIQYCTALTKQNVQDHIFDRLGVNDLSTGTVTITLASAVLALFTQEEIDAVVERTNITIVGV